MTDELTSKKIKITYPSERMVTIRRFPTDEEIKRGINRNKLVEEEIFAFYNEIELKIYNKPPREFVRIITGGLFDIIEKIPMGVFINIKMKNADEELKKDINEISRDLCKKLLKPCICYPGRYTTHVIISDYEITIETANIFLREFSKEIKKRTRKYHAVIQEEAPKVKSKEKEADKPKEDTTKKELLANKCPERGKELTPSKTEHILHPNVGKEIPVCKECYRKLSDIFLGEKSEKEKYPEQRAGKPVSPETDKSTFICSRCNKGTPLCSPPNYFCGTIRIPEISDNRVRKNLVPPYEIFDFDKGMLPVCPDCYKEITKISGREKKPKRKWKDIFKLKNKQKHKPSKFDVNGSYTCSCGYNGPLKIVKEAPIGTHAYWNAYCSKCGKHIWHADGLDESILKQQMHKILEKNPDLYKKKKVSK